MNLYNFTVMAKRIEDGKVQSHACALLVYLPPKMDLEDYGRHLVNNHYKAVEGYYEQVHAYKEISDKFMDDAGWVRKSSLADDNALKFLGNA